MRPKCRIQARGQKGGPNLGLQHTIDTTRGAIARQAEAIMPLRTCVVVGTWQRPVAISAN